MTKDKLEQLIKAGESDRVEFTVALNDMDKYRQAICAFANDLPNSQKPGFLLIGIENNGTSGGLTISDKLLQTLGGLRNDGKIQPLPSMSVTKHRWQDSDVAIIKVEPSENPPVKVANRCWIRTGPSRALANPEDERRLTEKRRWGNLPYDMQGVSGASVTNDIDMQKFEEYMRTAVSPEALEENSRQQEDQLKALRLTTQDATPTTTAILTLGKDSRYWFPGAYIQYVRYDGNKITDDVLDSKEITGTLFDQLQTLDESIKLNIATKMDRSGIKHIEQPDYPFVALRELAHNAVIHRNYENTNAPIRLYWFKERIEIDSPGSLYGRMTKDNIGKENDYRNPTIAEAMRNMGFMEKFGSGISTARKALEDNGNPPPEFQIEETRIHVTIRMAT